MGVPAAHGGCVAGHCVHKSYWPLISWWLEARGHHACDLSAEMLFFSWTHEVSFPVQLQTAQQQALRSMNVWLMCPSVIFNKV